MVLEFLEANCDKKQINDYRLQAILVFSIVKGVSKLNSLLSGI